MEVEHKFADNSGVKLHYVKAGSGPPVVLLHGFPENWYSWRKVIPELSEHYTVIAPDLRGYNRSDKPKGWKNYLPSLLADDLEAIMEAEGFDCVKLVAHDWGGAVGWEMGIHRPEKVEKLVIIDSPHPKIFAHHLRKNRKQQWKSWYMFFFQIPLLPELIIRASVPLFMKKTLPGWAHNPDAFSKDDLRVFVRGFKKKRAVTSALAYYRAGFRGRKLMTEDQGKPIEVPTMVIWAENDTALGLELTDDIEKYVNAEYRLEIIPDCSHWVQSEYPEKVNELLKDFFRVPETA